MSLSDIQRYNCYYLNDIGDEYPSFSEEKADGEWVKWEDVKKHLPDDKESQQEQDKSCEMCNGEINEQTDFNNNDGSLCPRCNGTGKSKEK